MKAEKSLPYRFEDRIVSRLVKVDFLPPLLARITLASAFLVSGKRKFNDLKGTVDFFKQVGIPMSGSMVPFVAGTEVACGSLVGAGLVTRAAALPLIPIMVVAILTTRRQEIHSFSDLTGIYEFTYILLLSYLFAYGGGKASIDHLVRQLLLRSRLEKEKAAGRVERAA